MLTLQRAWVWANHARDWMDQSLIHAFQARDGAPLEWRDTETLEVDTCAMYLTYALLWAVIERLTDLRDRFAGSLRDDLRSVRTPLERARNATFHVTDAYWDDRLFDLLGQSAQSISRVHHGLGRMIREEIDCRLDFASN